jgi:hypothetical protein
LRGSPVFVGGAGIGSVQFFADHRVREVITITEMISSISKMENTFLGRIIVNIELINRYFGKGKLILFKIYC